MKAIILLLSLLILLSYAHSSDAAENHNFNLKKDGMYTLDLLWKGSYKQFTTGSNLAYLGAFGGATYWAYGEDDRLVDYYASKDLEFYHKVASELSILTNFPLIPIATYYIASKINDTKLKQFSMEFAASLYLALVETSLISWVPIHDRPNPKTTTFWETAFRQSSSFPSGHIIPFATLTFKVMQFYGPYWAMLPAVMTYFTGYERVQDRQHYVSDILSGILLAAAASEGVRAAANYKGNHPFYKWIYEHSAKVGLIRHNDVFGPRLVWNY